MVILPCPLLLVLGSCCHAEAHLWLVGDTEGSQSWALVVSSHCCADVMSRPSLAVIPPVEGISQSNNQSSSAKAFGKLCVHPFHDQMQTKQGGNGLKPGQDVLLPSISK